MKSSINRTLSAAALAVALLALSALAPTPALAAGSTPGDPVAQAMNLTGSLPVKAASPYLEMGSYRIWVSSHLGKPTHVLADGTWIYERFTVEDSNVGGSLVVRFQQGQVSELRLVSPAVLTAMLSSPKMAPGMLIASRGK